LLRFYGDTEHSSSSLPNNVAGKVPHSQSDALVRLLSAAAEPALGKSHPFPLRLGTVTSLVDPEHIAAVKQSSPCSLINVVNIGL